jgi:hypothetical protein
MNSYAEETVCDNLILDSGYNFCVYLVRYNDA